VPYAAANAPAGISRITASFTYRQSTQFQHCFGRKALLNIVLRFAAAAAVVSTNSSAPLHRTLAVAP
jgi:hypothetical protein